MTQINEEGNVEVLDVYDDTPASEAGLMRGDLLIEINGVPFTGMSLSEFLANVRAEDGAANDFVIRRGEETLSFRIVAREVHTPSVSYRMLTDTIGYIHLTAFHGTCVEETKTAMKELREQGMEKLVLDFRDNLGGSCMTRSISPISFCRRITSSQRSVRGTERLRSTRRPKAASTSKPSFLSTSFPHLPANLSRVRSRIMKPHT